MALKLTSKSAVRFSWADDTMEALWALKPDDSEAELISKMEQIITFVRSRTEKPPALPERIPGMALGMTQEAHPAPAQPTNGWATLVQPQIPEDRKGDWELIPPGEA